MLIVLVLSELGLEVVNPGHEDLNEKPLGEKRKCPHCGLAISREARTCPSCGQKLYPPLLPITHDKIAALLQQIDKATLTSSPEEYFTKAQEHAWNRQVKEAALELGKVLLVSKPKSEIHLKAERLLKKMGYRF